MSTNWAYNLDLLAQNGVIDFDAPSFVMNQNPRYIGRPSYPPSPYAGTIPPAPALNQPKVDEFKPQKTHTVQNTKDPDKFKPEKQQIPEKEEKNNDIIKNPSWKKWTFGILAIGGLVLAGFKFKSIMNWIKNKFSNTGSSISKKLKWSNIKTFCSKKWNSTKTFTTKYWNKFKGLFKKNKP